MAKKQNKRLRIRKYDEGNIKLEALDGIDHRVVVGLNRLNQNEKDN